MSPKGWRALATLSLALAPLAAADICSKLDTENIQIEQSPSLDYTSELHDYWSLACGDLKPTCIVYPSSAQEMATVIKELHRTDDFFAVKSGGHMPNAGFASVQDGVLISTKNLNQIVYNKDDQTADVGPGLSWEDAQKGLDGNGRTLVGGRMGGVGIGGYMLGRFVSFLHKGKMHRLTWLGGLSFLSSQYGWAANNVVDFEVVLANGTVTHANAKENSDLFLALKGGGSSFGIVTNYRMKTHPQDHKVWGGNYFFSADKTPEILEAVRDFTANYPDDKAAIILTADHTPILNTWVMFLFYDGVSLPDGVFDRFKTIGPTDATKTWDSYYDLLKNNDFFILKGQRYVIGTETTPLPSKDAASDVFQTIYDHWMNVTNNVLGVPNVIASMAFQPMPRTITKKAKELGGDMIDFPTDQDYIIFELDFSYSFAASDTKIDGAHQELYNGLGNIISNYVDEGVLPDVYRPLFMNYAYHRQDYWGRLRTTERAKRTRERYDPEGFLQKRTSGGFRLE